MIGGERRPYTGNYGQENVRPAEGEVVAYEWAAWEVTHVADAVSTAEEDEKLRAYKPEFRAGHGPYLVVTLRRRHGPKSANGSEVFTRCSPRRLSSPSPHQHR